jgi:group I intron endonuclease
MVGIYKITSPNGRIYIGQSTDIEYRFIDYRRHHCKNQIRVYNSFLTHGVENHIFEVLEECEFEDLDCRERHHQDIYDVTSRQGLNCMLTECGEKRRIYSEEVRKKMSDNSTNVRAVVCQKTKQEWSSVTKCAIDNNIQLLQLFRRLTGKVKNKTSFTFKNIEAIEGVDYHNFKSDVGNRKIKCVITGKTWDTIIECVKENNLHNRQLRGQLSGNCKNPTSYIYFESEIEIGVNCLYIKNKKPTPISTKSKKVIDTKSSIIYPCIREAAESIGILASTLGKFLNGKLINTTTLKYYK